MPRKILVLAVSCVLVLAVAETVAWFLYAPPTHPRKAEYDQRLGWKPRAHVSSVRMLKDSAGRRYRCRYTTTRDGFREYGNPAEPSRPKVLFVGDSFTQSIAVSNKDTYFRRLAARLDLELFALGQSGYGTLQELLACEDSLAEIRPRLIVLQVCDNDFIDNHVVLEREASYNLGLRRPYMDIDGVIRSRVPASELLDLLTRSKAGAWALHRSRRLPGSSMRTTDAELRITNERAGYPTFQDSIVITSRIIERFKHAADEVGADLVAFGASSYQPQLEMFEQLCEYKEVPFTAAAVEALERATEAGDVVTAADRCHWNPHGHGVVAKALEPFLLSRLESPRGSDFGLRP